MTAALTHAVPSVLPLPEAVLLVPVAAPAGATADFAALLAAAQPAATAPAVAEATSVAPEAAPARASPPPTAAQVANLVEADPLPPFRAVASSIVEAAPHETASDTDEPDVPEANGDAGAQPQPQPQPQAVTPVLAMPLPVGKSAEAPGVGEPRITAAALDAAPQRRAFGRSDVTPVSPVVRDAAPPAPVSTGEVAPAELPAKALHGAEAVAPAASPAATSLVLTMAASPATCLPGVAVVMPPPMPSPTLAAPAVAAAPEPSAPVVAPVVAAVQEAPPAPQPLAPVAAPRVVVQRERKPVPETDAARPRVEVPDPAPLVAAVPALARHGGQSLPVALHAPAPATATQAEPAVQVATDRFGDVRIGLEGGARDLKVSLSVGSGAPSLLAAEAPRLVADLAANGIRLQSLDVGSFAGGGGQNRSPQGSQSQPAPNAPAASIFTTPAPASRAVAADRYA